MLTAAQLTAITDCMCRQYAVLAGSKDSGHGFGESSLPIEHDWGLSAESRRLRDFILESRDWALIKTMGDVAHGILQQASGKHAAGSILQTFYRKLELAAAQSGYPGVRNIKTLADYYNTGPGGPYSALLAPEFLPVLGAIIPGSKLPAADVYSPPIDNMGEAAVGVSASPKKAVDINTYAGAGRPVAITSGVVAGKGGSKRLTVIGYGRTASGTVMSGRRWIVESALNDSVFDLQPETEGDLLTQVLDVRLPTCWASGIVTIAALRPEGRDGWQQSGS